jgi:hypothetical protein
MEHITIQLEREIYCIKSDEEYGFKKEISIRLIEFEAWWETISIQAPQNIIKACIIHFGYPKIQIV